MTDESEGSRVHRHPDAADCPEGLPEDEAAVHPPPVRRHADGLTRCWIEDGQVRSRDVAGDGTPDALPGRLAAGPGSGAPDLDGVERALRDASPGGGAAAPSFCRAAGRDAAGAGVRGLRQADGPARDAEEGLAHAARPGRGGAHAFPLPVLRQGVLPA